MYTHRGDRSRIIGVLISLILLLVVIFVQWGWGILPDVLFNLLIVFFLASVVCFGCCLSSADAKDIAEFPKTY